MSRRGKRWVLAASILSLTVIVAVTVLPVPFLSRSPGPVFDVLGQTDGQPTLAVSGTRTYPTTGELDLTTVAELGGPAGPLTVGAGLIGWFSPDTEVVPDEELRTEGDLDLEVALFDASLSSAVAAAADHLDRPVDSAAYVVAVSPGSPADGVLQPGDEIRRVDGDPVDTSAQVGKAISSQPAGTEFTLRIVREGKAMDVQVASAQSEGSDRPLIGIVVENSYTSDFDAELNLDGIGGPSAGTMLALGMVDKLTPEDLIGGRHVAGTGTVDADGSVGEIGGADKKVIAARDAGAELFLVPRSNCGDVAGKVPDGLTVVPISTLTEAVDAVKAWRGGRPVESCPADPPPADND